MMTLLLGPPRVATGCDPRTAPLSFLIEGRELRLVASPWLNLMPIPVKPLDKHAPFRANVTILAVDSLPLSRSVLIDSVWVAAGQHTWGGRLEGASRSADSSRLMRVVWGAPPWLLQADSVDVAARVRTGKRIACLRAPRAHLVRAE